MRKILSFFVALFVSIASFAQAPLSFSYQAVLRDISGTAISNQPVALRISILETSPAGTAVYAETHQATTNAFGLVTLKVGEGQIESGVFAVFPEGAKLYVQDGSTTANSGFSIYGRDGATTTEYVKISPDSMRFYVKISSPRMGTMIFNTTDSCLQVYLGYWESIWCTPMGCVYPTVNIQPLDQAVESDAGNPGTTQGICPTGWHVPTDAEWTDLVSYLGGTSGSGVCII
ncbi:MAG: fibrobacter succinogenes major paralogous domain-containing protein [Bacteroidetes bacterium]|nr:fibrobacter succinogenes major paralogous domain-containing protein [Bacteroidota bacterium]MBU1718067.1 fibrobacter succinogenes major paralogous domain-containing protein [Bacteroidota bacterium]